MSAGLAQSTNFPAAQCLADRERRFLWRLHLQDLTRLDGGVFLNGSWYIDRNRNGGYDGTAAGDETFSFGQSGDVPVVGDWTGSGTVKIGVFRNGQWLLDCNGNGVWDGACRRRLPLQFRTNGRHPRGR